MAAQINIRRILFATDFSENSRSALDYAVMFAQQFGAAVLMMHVVQLSQAAHEAEIEMDAASMSRSAGEQRLATMADGLQRLGISVEKHVIDGFAGEAILASVQTYDVDLLVLGIHGLHHGLTYLLMGSTSEMLLTEAECPVLTVGGNVLSGFDIGKDLDHVLFVSDLSVEAARAASYTLFFAARFKRSGGRLRLDFTRAPRRWRAARAGSAGVLHEYEERCG